MKIEISETTFQRLQTLAVPLVDTVEDVIVRLLDSTSSNQGGKMDANTVLAKLIKDYGGESIKGFQKELWELVVLKIPDRSFSLRDVYARQDVLRKLRPDVEEIEAAIRKALQVLRDKGYLKFLGRGEYERLRD